MMQPTCPSADKWIKQNVICNITEYYSALKKKVISTNAATRMTFKKIIPSEISQWQRTNTVRFHFYEASKVIPRCWGRGDGELVFDRISFEKEEKVLGMDDGNDYATMWMYLIPLNMVEMANFMYIELHF